MVKSRRMAWALIAAFAVLIPAAAPAAEKDLKIAVVDIRKVYTEAPRIKQYTDELYKFRDGLDAKLDIRGRNVMLTNEEIVKLIDLKIKAAQTDPEKAEITSLENTEKGRDAELKKLQATKEPNDQDKARMKELQDMQQKSKDAVTSIAKDYQGQLQTKVQETDAVISTDLREAIKKVAEAKGYTLIFDKIAVPYGGTEITDDVIAKLDRKT